MGDRGNGNMKKKRIRIKNVELTCKECGKKFMVENHRKNSAKYCCRECSSHASGRKLQKYELKTVICPVCGKEFSFKSRNNRKDRTYCSAECRAIGVGLKRRKEQTNE